MSEVEVFYNAGELREDDPANAGLEGPAAADPPARRSSRYV